MEDNNSSSSTNATTSSGAAKYLTGLPSRGLFSSTVPSSTPGGMRIYVCDHETSPPEDQLIKTNQQNILIRSLMLKKQSSKDGKAISSNDNGRKRAADKALDSRAATKKATTSNQVASSQVLLKASALSPLARGVARRGFCAFHGHGEQTFKRRANGEKGANGAKARRAGF